MLRQAFDPVVEMPLGVHLIGHSAWILVSAEFREERGMLNIPCS